MKKLLLCSGPPNSPYRHDGSDWFTVDSNPRADPHFISSIPPLPYRVLNNRPWNRVALIHGIEHFYLWDAAALLTEIRPILSPDGFLILEQPDISKCGSNASFIFGDPSHNDPGMLHRWGYTPETLSRLLLDCGYKRTVVKPALFHDPNRDFRIEAYPHIGD